MGNFKNLPTDIVLDIITRLPTESILDCKLVSKPWRNLVSYHPSFSRLHLAHLNRSTDSGKLSYLVRDYDEQVYYFEYSESHDGTPVHSTRRFNSTTPFSYSRHVILGSFNGLVCLYKSDHTCLIYNPVTREYVFLPKFKGGFGESGDEYFYCSSGFGYLPLTNEYKVVVLYASKGEPSFIEAALYTLGGSNGWRNVGRLEYGTGAIPKYTPSGVYANGALHWREKDGQGRVLVYDLTEEKFGEHLSPPSTSPVALGGCRIYYSIGELGGVLYYVVLHFFNSDVDADIWLLKEKKDTRDVKELEAHEPLGWSKAFSLPEKEPLAFTKSGGVLCFNYKFLDIFDATTSTSEKLVDFGAFSQIFPHNNTLVSLKEPGEGDIKVMETAEIEETETRDSSTKQLTR